MLTNLSNTSLIDINQTLPVQFSIELDCSENKLQNTIEEVASFVSKVYAKFPRLQEEERENLRKRGVWFHKLKDLPSISECEKFEVALKQRIITVLNKKENYKCSIRLSTDYYPQKQLYKIAKSIFSEEYRLGYFFPYKTCTRIYLKDEKTKLCINMNFKGPLF